MIPFIDFKASYKLEQKAIDFAIKKVLNSGIYILGNEVKSFESEFSKYIGSKYAVSCASGTDALFLTLKALGIKTGDEVITQANSALPTACAISMAGAKPVFLDINPNSFGINHKLIEKIITKKTKAVIAVHLYGIPFDIKNVLSVIKKHNLHLIEDCAQAHGTEYHGKKAGSFGFAWCFSFYPTKNLGAIGDGGIITTNNKNLANKIKLLREYGQKEKNYSIIPGYNSRLDELQAAILRTRLKILNKNINLRIKKARLYNSLLKNLPIITPQEQKSTKNSYHLYVIRTKDRNNLKTYLKSKGIETMIHYPYPIHLQTLYKHL